MVASADTINRVLLVVLRHVDVETARAIVADLKEIDGNASFRQTIQKLEEKLKGFPA